MITKLSIVRTSSGNFEIIEPLTGVVVGSSVIYQFARLMSFGFLDCLIFLSDNPIGTFIPEYSNIAYLLGAKKAVELFEDFKSKCPIVRIALRSVPLFSIG
jgi:hypothetical protein